MPIVSMFFGIVIRMYYREHGPAHFHAEYADREGTITFDGDPVTGDLRSRRAKRWVRLWAKRQRARLEEIWRRAARREAILPIPPLE